MSEHLEQQTFSIQLSDVITFNTTEPIRVSDIVRSLQALEKIVHQSDKTFSALTNSEIESVELLIDRIESGSIIEKIILKLTFKTEENFERFLENTHDWLKGQCREQPVRTSIVGLAIGGMIAYGFYHLGGQSASDKVTVSGNYNTVIVNGAGQLGISEEQFKHALEVNKSQQKTLTKNAVEFAQVAKTENGAIAIEIGADGKGITLPESVVEAIPTKAPKAEIEVKYQEMPKAVLNIRTLDRDNYNGWTAYIEGFFTKRVRLEIPNTADLNVLSKQESVIADVVLHYKPKNDGIDPQWIELKTLHTK